MIRICALSLATAVMANLLACSGSDAGAAGSGGNTNPPAAAGAAAQSPPPTSVVTTEKFGEQHSGDGTYYTFADGTGACLYDKTSDFHIAALNGFDWAGSAWCGACADVTGPNGNQVRVRIVDECPDCAQGQLDFHPDAFAVLAPKEQGRIAITWTFVACDAQGPVSYKFKDGSNPYWTAVQVRNSRFPIAKLETSKDGVSFVEAPRQDYNYFLNGSGFGGGTTQVRITAQNGMALTDTLPEVQAELVVAGMSQFQ
ncbi:MAG: expansin EXLX1 family cellulose-binding protein [Pseudomonadota bacterium]